ncbi:hypothetical protein GOP47_0000538 [Adiantum capillus-veneris]|uniref:CBM20 domain-containing protein n=1 Tax=Adiantum capillus-veneris TaxID=13818 RepID=A0A9D4ZQM5_ADICA|nr:hypothetical protein GOP47_0000538 [Adiantum capillus-veneris]
MGQGQVMVEVILMNKHLGDGERDDALVVVGSIAQLGNWLPSQGLRMLPDSLIPNSWTASVNLPAGLVFEYKIVRLSADGMCRGWMAGSNRALLVPRFATMVSVVNLWEFVAGSSPVTITFGIVKQLGKDGGHLLLSGDSKELGQWKLDKAHSMVWHIGDRWKVDTNVTAGSTINYKYLSVSDHVKEVEWMPGPNRVMQVPKGAIALTVLDRWTTHSVPSIRTTTPIQVQNVAVYVVLVQRCSFGHLFKLVGNIDKLGKWDPWKAQKMVWHFNDIWITAINLHAGSFLEYKIVLAREADDTIIQWQTGSNKRLLVPDTDHELLVEEVWQ